MTDDQLQLNAQRSLQEFDDARGSTNSNLYDLGQNAIDALDSFIDNWSDKPYMQHMNVDLSEGGHDALKQYAKRQIKWAEKEQGRVRALLTLSDGESESTVQ